MSSSHPLRCLYIYTSWRCNLRCAHCWVSAGPSAPEPPGGLTVDQVVKTIDQAITLGLRMVKLSGGEPLLDGDMVVAVTRKADRAGLKCFVETNGTLLTKELLGNVPRTCEFRLSVDGASAGPHDALRGVAGAFDKMERGLETLIDLGFPVGITHAVQRRTTDSIGEVIRYAEAHGVRSVKLNPIMHLGRASGATAVGARKQAFVLSAQEMVDLLNTYCIQNHGDVVVDMMMPVAFSLLPRLLRRGSREPPHASCPTLNLLSVLPNGDVGLCGEAREMRELRFGNINETPLQHIWSGYSSPELRALRDGVPRNLRGVCGYCAARDVCLGSCRVIALTTGGCLTSANPICQELEDRGKFWLGRRERQ